MSEELKIKIILSILVAWLTVLPQPVYLIAGQYIDVRPTASITVIGGTLSSLNTAKIAIRWIGN